MDVSDWLRPKKLSANAPTLEHYTTTLDADTGAAAGSTANTNLPLSKGQRFIIGLGIGGMAIFIIRATYHSTRSGPPQILWTTPQVVMKKKEKHQPLLDNAENVCGTRPTLVLVNFPGEMRGQLEHSLRPLINDTELELLYAPVVFFHDTMEVTPGNIEAVVRQEVLAAFSDLGGDTPCAVYRSALVVDGEAPNIFWTPKEAMKASQGRVFHERHCIGYTVDGGRVEILLHDTYGTVGAPFESTPKGKSDFPSDDVDGVIRCCFCASTRTFAIGSEEEYDTIGDLALSGPTKRIEGPYAASFRVLWLSPVPLFAMLGAALRYSRVEFDGWRRLAKPGIDGISPAWVVRQLRRLLWWRSGEVEVNADGPATAAASASVEQPQDDEFLLEVEILQDPTCVQASHRDMLRDVLAKNWVKSSKNIKNGYEELVVTAGLPTGAGAVLRCSLRPRLTVFQALREAWRLVALVSCLKYDVRCFRLLVPVRLVPPSTTTVAKPIASTEASWPHVPLYPHSKEEAESSYPSFYSDAQYFCLVEECGRVEAEEAFRRIREGDVKQLHYVVADYMTDELKN
ncbi:hypothetical protein DQ04_00331110 [Trypanosoma grayi]|uniref:hypothetical protein n=1 Tax=Trypanosoma grayi TaxID=71804 RepID=UPI0004F4101F|nr:hypothetical protein DQ04_00331110 [Trypanosoma grayi]KEG14718.1 hypothetical protein DQ04_00331110 [Trypanosoma grayi]